MTVSREIRLVPHLCLRDGGGHGPVARHRGHRELRGHAFQWSRMDWGNEPETEHRGVRKMGDTNHTHQQ